MNRGRTREVGFKIGDLVLAKKHLYILYDSYGMCRRNPDLIKFPGDWEEATTPATILEIKKYTYYNSPSVTVYRVLLGEDLLVRQYFARHLKKMG